MSATPEVTTHWRIALYQRFSDVLIGWLEGAFNRSVRFTLNSIDELSFSLYMDSQFASAVIPAKCTVRLYRIVDPNGNPTFPPDSDPYWDQPDFAGYVTNVTRDWTNTSMLVKCSSPLITLQFRHIKNYTHRAGLTVPEQKSQGRSWSNEYLYNIVWDLVNFANRGGLPKSADPLDTFTWTAAATMLEPGSGILFASGPDQVSLTWTGTASWADRYDPGGDWHTSLAFDSGTDTWTDMQQLLNYGTQSSSASFELEGVDIYPNYVGQRVMGAGQPWNLGVPTHKLMKVDLTAFRGRIFDRVFTVTNPDNPFFGLAIANTVGPFARTDMSFDYRVGRHNLEAFGDSLDASPGKFGTVVAANGQGTVGGAPTAWDWATNPDGSFAGSRLEEYGWWERYDSYSNIVDPTALDAFAHATVQVTGQPIQAFTGITVAPNVFPFYGRQRASGFSGDYETGDCVYLNAVRGDFSYVNVPLRIYETTLAITDANLESATLTVAPDFTENPFGRDIAGL